MTFYHEKNQLIIFGTEVSNHRFDQRHSPALFLTRGVSMNLGLSFVTSVFESRHLSTFEYIDQIFRILETRHPKIQFYKPYLFLSSFKECVLGFLLSFSSSSAIFDHSQFYDRNHRKCSLYLMPKKNTDFSVLFPMAE